MQHKDTIPHDSCDFCNMFFTISVLSFNSTNTLIFCFHQGEEENEMQISLYLRSQKLWTKMHNVNYRTSRVNHLHFSFVKVSRWFVKNVCKLDIRSEYWGGFRNLSNFVMETKSGRIIFLSNQPQHFEIVQTEYSNIFFSNSLEFISIYLWSHL